MCRLQNGGKYRDGNYLLHKVKITIILTTTVKGILILMFITLYFTEILFFYSEKNISILTQQKFCETW